MKAQNFDQAFDENSDITASLDLTQAKRVVQEQKRVNVDFPSWMVESLDREASKLGITRQSIIKVWLAERLKAETSRRMSVRKSLIDSLVTDTGLTRGLAGAKTKCNIFYGRMLHGEKIQTT